MPDPQVGEPAPDFDLPDQTTARVRLSEVVKEGPAVLLFYVLDFTGG